MAIRKWRENDLPQIKALMDELNDALEEDQIIEIDNITEHFSYMENKNDVYENYVYEENGIIKGFVSIIFYRSIYHKKGTALINELVVANTYRNKGIGEELLKYAISVAKQKEMDEIEVGVMKRNMRAIRFYKKHGITEEYILLGMEFK